MTYAIYQAVTNEDTGVTTFHRQDVCFETYGLAQYHARRLNDLEAAEFGYLESPYYVAKVGKPHEYVRDPRKTAQQVIDEDFIPF